MPTIRNGCAGDAAAIATLAGELGYAVNVVRVRERLAAVERALELKQAEIMQV